MTLTRKEIVALIIVILAGIVLGRLAVRAFLKAMYAKW